MCDNGMWYVKGKMHENDRKYMRTVLHQWCVQLYWIVSEMKVASWIKRLKVKVEYILIKCVIGIWKGIVWNTVYHMWFELWYNCCTLYVN